MGQTGQSNVLRPKPYVWPAQYFLTHLRSPPVGLRLGQIVHLRLLLDHRNHLALDHQGFVRRGFVLLLFRILCYSYQYLLGEKVCSVENRWCVSLCSADRILPSNLSPKRNNVKRDKQFGALGFE